MKISDLVTELLALADHAERGSKRAIATSLRTCAKKLEPHLALSTESFADELLAAAPAKKKTASKKRQGTTASPEILQKRSEQLVADFRTLRESAHQKKLNEAALGTLTALVLSSPLPAIHQAFEVLGFEACRTRPQAAKYLAGVIRNSYTDALRY